MAYILMKRYDRQRKWRRAAVDMDAKERAHCELAEVELPAKGPGASDAARIILEALEKAGVLTGAAEVGKHHKIPVTLHQATLERLKNIPTQGPTAPGAQAAPYELPDCLKPGWSEKYSVRCPDCGARCLQDPTGLHYCPACTPRCLVCGRHPAPSPGGTHYRGEEVQR